jgi:hypothetical protein
MMVLSRRPGRRGAGLAAIVFVVAAATGMQGQQPGLPDPRFEEARQAYEATNYEQALTLLDGIISRSGDPSQRQTLLASYELRGRTRLNMRDEEGARSDFRAVLVLNPSATLPAQAGPRAQTLFDEVKKATVRDVRVSVTPSDAVVTLGNAKLVERPAIVPLAIGSEHTISAIRNGHRTRADKFMVVSGEGPQEITFTLEREFATLTLTTAPANVEVLLDGVLRGRTETDPAAIAGAGIGEAGSSKPFVVDNLAAGRHRVEFRRDCFIGVEKNVDVQRPEDITEPVVRLSPAVASVAISSDTPNATIFIDETPQQGAPPQTLSDICQGPHVFEVRTRAGRHVKRMDLKAGQKETFSARVRPGFAIVSDSGINAGILGAPDLRLSAETQFQDTKTLTLFASPATRTQELLAPSQLPADWLSFDPLRRATGGATKVGDLARRDAGARLAKAFDAQGVAAVAQVPGVDKSDLILVLLAPGSAKPDVVRWRVDDPVSVRQAASRMDSIPPVTRSSLGLLAIDVLDVTGAVVASVEPGGGAAAAGLQPGDIVTAAAGGAVANAAQLLLAVNARPAGQALPLDIRDRAGAVKKVDVTPQRVPRLIEERDQTVLSNVLAVQFASLAYSAATPLDEVAIRLNLAGALMRVENWNDATRELEAVVKLTAGGPFPQPLKEAITGSAQYLLGACAESSGDVPGAERAWGLAAQSTSALLTDSGEPIKELAERRLSELRRTRGTAR